jgi:hypothetical protein
MPTIIRELFGPEPDEFAEQIKELWGVLRRCEQLRAGTDGSLQIAAKATYDRMAVNVVELEAQPGLRAEHHRTVSTPASAPRPTAHFIGRGDERDALARELGLSEGLFRALAWEFGHQDSKLGIAEYQEFLRSKASEYHKLNELLSSITEIDAKLHNQTAAARDALSRGDFDEVENILSAAEELQRDERTLQEVRKQVSIRLSRSENALLRGDLENSYNHCIVAADLFMPFDPLAASEVLLDFALALNVSARSDSYGADAWLHISVKTSKAALDRISVDEKPVQWAMAMRTLGGAFSKFSRSAKGEAIETYLLKAVECHKAALRVLKPDEDLRQWASQQFILGYELHALSLHKPREASMKLKTEAAAAFTAGLAVEHRQTVPSVLTNSSILGGGIVQGHLAALLEELKEMETESTGPDDV